MWHFALEFFPSWSLQGIAHSHQLISAAKHFQYAKWRPRKGEGLCMYVNPSGMHPNRGATKDTGPLCLNIRQGRSWNSLPHQNRGIPSHPTSAASDASDNYANCCCHYVNTCLCQIWHLIAAHAGRRRRRAYRGESPRRQVTGHRGAQRRSPRRRGVLDSAQYVKRQVSLDMSMLHLIK